MCSKRTILYSLLCLAVLCSSASAQFLTSARDTVTVLADGSKQIGELRRFVLFGVGGFATGEANEPNMPSARFSLEWNPYIKRWNSAELEGNGYIKPSLWPPSTSRISVSASFNKGAGLDLIAGGPEDSTSRYTRRPLVFPEASNSAFLGSVEVTLWTFVQDSGRSFVDLFSPFGEYVWQTYSTATDSGTVSFDASTVNLGVRLVSMSSVMNGLPISLTGSVFGSRLAISDSGLDDYRAVFSDSLLDDTFWGWGGRVSADISNFVMEFEYKRYIEDDGVTGDGITNGQFTIKTAIKGVIFEGKKKK